MTLRKRAKVLLHVWSFDFHDTTLSATSYDKYVYAASNTCHGGKISKKWVLVGAGLGLVCCLVVRDSTVYSVILVE